MAHKTIRSENGESKRNSGHTQINTGIIILASALPILVAIVVLFFIHRWRSNREKIERKNELSFDADETHLPEIIDYGNGQFGDNINRSKKLNIMDEEIQSMIVASYALDRTNSQVTSSLDSLILNHDRDGKYAPASMLGSRSHSPKPLTNPPPAASRSNRNASFSQLKSTQSSDRLIYMSNKHPKVHHHKHIAGQTIPGSTMEKQAQPLPYVPSYSQRNASNPSYNEICREPLFSGTTSNPECPPALNNRFQGAPADLAHIFTSSNPCLSSKKLNRHKCLSSCNSDSHLEEFPPSLSASSKHTLSACSKGSYNSQSDYIKANDSNSTCSTDNKISICDDFSDLTSTNDYPTSDSKIKFDDNQDYLFRRHYPSSPSIDRVLLRRSKSYSLSSFDKPDIFEESTIDDIEQPKMIQSISFRESNSPRHFLPHKLSKASCTHQSPCSCIEKSKLMNMKLRAINSKGLLMAEGNDELSRRMDSIYGVYVEDP